MTIQLNKSEIQNIVRITFDAYPDDYAKPQSLIIYNEFNQQVFTLPLGLNQSSIGFRYGKYTINQPDVDLSSIEVGMYLYKVVNTEDQTCNCGPVLSRGSLVVKENLNKELLPIVYKDPQEDGDYVTYQG